MAPFATSENINSAVLMLLNKQVLACGGHNKKNCFLYDVLTNNWTMFSNISTTHDSRGVVHQGKIYLPNDIISDVFDPFTKVWSTWPIPPNTIVWSCYVSWKHYIIKFGGYDSDAINQIWRFDTTTNVWTRLNTTVPFPFNDVGCTVLPNDNVLIAGSKWSSTCWGSIVEYNVTANNWSSVVQSYDYLYNSIPLVLGKRVFIIPSSATEIVWEYFYENQITIPVSQPFISITASSPSIAVPAIWFGNFPGVCIGIK